MKMQMLMPKLTRKDRSADGTSILTSSSDNILRTYFLPQDLLEAPPPHTLSPYSHHCLPEPSYATAIYPSYNLGDPSTCLVLASLRDLPIRLISPYAPAILASYPLVSPTTEAWIAPYSLVFSPNEPNTFFAGADGLIAEFDMQRNGEEPVASTRTGQGRKRSGMQGLNDVGMNGIVSAMAINGDGVLAAGTFTRRLGLYDGNGRGGTVGVFHIGGDDDLEATRGRGITQVIWSLCGRYLCVVERNSDGVSIWDIRGAGKRLAWLEGRQARTQQRLYAEVIGDELWAGGIDGKVRVWKGLGTKEGAVSPAWSFQAHSDAIGSATLHPTGSVLATCSGQRHFTNATSYDMESEDEGRASSISSLDSPASCSSIASNGHTAVLYPDSSLKVWRL